MVTDFKSDNLEGLSLLARLAGPNKARFIPQIYTPDQFKPVAKMGFSAPIFTVYSLGDEGWQREANALPLRAVTIPVERKYLASGIRHFVFLHTVNEPMEGVGLYTDCLIPT